VTAAYCVIPYKTPWCALGFLHGMILLAGVGAAVLVRAAPGYALKSVVVVALLAATGHLAWQAYRASFVACDDLNNPYVYAHTTADVPRLAERIRRIAAAHPDGLAMHVQVICPEDDHWPLPWYLRDFTRVGWFSEIPKGKAAPLIVTQPSMEPALAEYLMVRQPPGERYMYVHVPSDAADGEWYLRPFVPLRVYVRLDLWERAHGQTR
jgi:predicted membrane-bound mannosyltransferase